jgi:hypothetical protein
MGHGNKELVDEYSQDWVLTTVRDNLPEELTRNMTELERNSFGAQNGLQNISVRISVIFTSKTRILSYNLWTFS